ncbi:MAG: TIGR02710 family CRISPR-associated CARF protein [Rhodocyclaceae bacterium]
MGTILFCTVGGSHQPIVTAINALRPAHVVFFCTDEDPATGSAGSRVQVEGSGLCIKERREDECATLRNIPTQCGLEQGTWEVVVVPADDLDGCYQTMRETFGETEKRFPGLRRIADYTGGTKTMTAALVLAALEDPEVTPQLVAGARADLVKVRDGSQAAMPAAVDALRLEREMAPLLAAWGRHAYDEAAAGLGALHSPSNERLRARWQRARDLSAAFAAWDRFDHGAARRLLGDYTPAVGRPLASHLAALGVLTGQNEAAREAARLLDLARNAERRAIQGRYDDAVARLYRLLEWSAQWLLRTVGIDTARVAPERIPAGLALQPGREGAFQAGLYAAWQLVGHHLPGSPAGRFFAAEGVRMLAHLEARNLSILAHGFEPVGRALWEDFHGWMERAFLPMLEEERRLRRVAYPVPQLPVSSEGLLDLRQVAHA